MGTFVALLRAVNVGGTGKLPMADLRAMCERLGFGTVRTHLATGNVVFTSGLVVDAVKSTLEGELLRYASKAVDVIMLTPAELRAISDANPFAAPRTEQVGGHLPER